MSHCLFGFWWFSPSASNALIKGSEDLVIEVLLIIICLDLLLLHSRLRVLNDFVSHQLHKLFSVFLLFWRFFRLLLFLLVVRGPQLSNGVDLACSHVNFLILAVSIDTLFDGTDAVFAVSGGVGVRELL